LTIRIEMYGVNVGMVSYKELTTFSPRKECISATPVHSQAKGEGEHRLCFTATSKLCVVKKTN